MTTAGDARERFWAKVDRSSDPDGCWLWTATRMHNGYGQFSVGGRRGGWTPAHRFAYATEVGEIPEGLWVLHTCDNPPCVNPAHLWVGTRSDNMRDCARKGRLGGHRIKGGPVPGERNGRATITDALALEIRRRFDAGESRPALATALRLPWSVVDNVARRRTFRHLDSVR